ncbi:C-4 methylsterol oxidase [Aspergillus arachidicola]|uniref:C-4 methylsterol oxidase n=1 Tax=Aspergillus arachidicola TaxID=656916 RepID=A0A2G7G3P9_9EURO|nr:C-4 methylsterol oxidase [Aspergillus arachidicola]
MSLQEIQELRRRLEEERRLRKEEQPLREQAEDQTEASDPTDDTSRVPQILRVRYCKGRAIQQQSHLSCTGISVMRKESQARIRHDLHETGNRLVILRRDYYFIVLEIEIENVRLVMPELEACQVMCKLLLATRYLVNSHILDVSNSTVLSPGTYWDQYQNITKSNIHLSVAERLWVTWYAWVQNDVLATGIMSFAIHELFYFGRALPWVFIDSLGFSGDTRFKVKVPSLREQWDCAKFVLLSHFTVELPQIWYVPTLDGGVFDLMFASRARLSSNGSSRLFHPMAQFCGLSTSIPFPSLWTMAYQIAIFFVMEDTWHYFFHRALHWGPLYKAIHKIHHQYSAPFGLAAEYASPIEVMILGFGTVSSPILWCALTGNLHILTMYVWIVLRLFQAIDAHSGYEFPWSLHHLLPFWAGADHHDLHHEKFIGNYASSFRWWDYLLDTEYTPDALKRRRGKMVEAKKTQ